jgi:hypothetical protein
MAEMATQAAIQTDQWIKTGSTGKPEKQSIDMVLLTPENANNYKGFAPLCKYYPGSGSMGFQAIDVKSSLDGKRSILNEYCNFSCNFWKS